MRILSQTNDIKGYHGTIGTLTNMYDYRGEQLFVCDRLKDRFLSVVDVADHPTEKGGDQE